MAGTERRDAPEQDKPDVEKKKAFPGAKAPGKANDGEGQTREPGYDEA